MDFSITTVQSDLYWEDKKANFKLFAEAIQKTSEKCFLTSPGPRERGYLYAGKLSKGQNLFHVGS